MQFTTASIIPRHGLPRVLALLAAALRRGFPKPRAQPTVQLRVHAPTLLFREAAVLRIPDAYLGLKPVAVGVAALLPAPTRARAWRGLSPVPGSTASLALQARWRPPSRRRIMRGRLPPAQLRLLVQPGRP